MHRDLSIKVESFEEGKGRGVIAVKDIAAQEGVYAAAPDIAILYSSNAGSLCSRCFLAKPTTAASSGAFWSCPTCDQFILCNSCHAYLTAAEASRSNSDDVCGHDGEAVSDHYQLAAHALACKWYTELPASVTAPGQDTDYLRFCLLYGAHVQLGNTRMFEALNVLASNEDVQCEEALNFCSTYARDLIVKTFGPSSSQQQQQTNKEAAPRYTVDADALRQVLLKIRCNTLGFPFSEEETLGWSLQSTLCMVNHSCTPNTAVVSLDDPNEGPHFNGVVSNPPCRDNDNNNNNNNNNTNNSKPYRHGFVGLKAIRPIVAGEEITISYVDLPSLRDDVVQRSRHLLDTYRFLCRCALCMEQRQMKNKGSSSSNSASIKFSSIL